MEKDVALGTDFELKVVFAAGKITVAVTFNGADAALDKVKPSLPAWAAPLIDGLKGLIDNAT